MLVLDQCARLAAPLPVRWACLVHDLGKGTTPPGQWPRHLGHEGRSAALARAAGRAPARAHRLPRTGRRGGARTRQRAPQRQPRRGGRCCACSSAATRCAGRRALRRCCWPANATARGRTGLRGPALCPGAAPAAAAAGGAGGRQRRGRRGRRGARRQRPGHRRGRAMPAGGACRPRCRRPACARSAGSSACAVAPPRAGQISWPISIASRLSTSELASGTYQSRPPRRKLKSPGSLPRPNLRSQRRQAVEDQEGEQEDDQPAHRGAQSVWLRSPAAKPMASKCDAAREADDLEQLAHLVLGQQLLRRGRGCAASAPCSSSSRPQFSRKRACEV